MLSYILACACGLCLLGADQYTKYIANTAYVSGKFEQPIQFINGIIDFVYTENSGGAWGVLSGYTWVLLSLTFIVMLICITLLLKTGLKSKLLFWAISLVVSGGIGNLIDRIFRDGKVVDFLHFEFYPTFPIFNVADIGVVIGAGLLILYFILDTVKETKIKKVITETKTDE